MRSTIGLFGILVGVLLTAGWTNGDQAPIDCYPDRGSHENICRNRGCNWISQQHPRAPWCQFDYQKMAGYDLTDLQTTSEFVAGKLKRRNTPTVFGGDFEQAALRIDHINRDTVRIRIVDRPRSVNDARSPMMTNRSIVTGDDTDQLYRVIVSTSPFGFAVARNDTTVKVIDTRNIPGLTFDLQYLQISTKVPTRNIYGLGETTHESFKHDFDFRKWGLFARDQPPGWGDMNLYGAHPFYLGFDDETGNAHGVYFRNTHAINVALQMDPENPNGGIITWRALGGVFDIYVFMGPTPDQVIQQYTEVIGRPNLPPYWSLGFQLCRYGYTNLNYLNDVFDRNRRANIPQDTQVIDIDYMHKKLDFTFDPDTYNNFTGFIKKVHDANMKLVLIVDPAIASDPDLPYWVLDSGIEQKVFIRDNRTGRPLEGAVWPGNSYYPDFSNPQTTLWWTEVIKKFYDDGVQFDGLWIDMNEPANFVTGSLKGCQSNRYNHPAFNPLIYDDFLEKTICMDADQYLGKHFELHNLYGHHEAKSTYTALQSVFPGKRPFVLSRSTAPGSGKYTNHWLGDNRSLWQHMRYSIIGMMEFNLFGIPMVGADICGFGLETTEEMCIRWQQLGAFYPFSRNHNDLGSKKDQDPAVWSESAVDIIRASINLRYSLLPYMYTQLRRASVGGNPIVRPMFFDFPAEPETRQIDDQFMLGTAMLVAPILYENARQRSVYFPKGRWFRADNSWEVPQSETNRRMEIPVALNETGLFYRGGHAFFGQTPALTTTAARQNPFFLTVSLDQEYQATGSLYWDDGESENGPYNELGVQAYHSDSRGGLRVQAVARTYNITPKLEQLQVLGIKEKPKTVKFDGVALEDKQMRFTPGVLSLTGLNVCLNKMSSEFEWEF